MVWLSWVVDFNTPANIEPAVLAAYDMPVGTDLEFYFDKTGRYFIDTNTGKRIERFSVCHVGAAVTYARSFFRWMHNL